MKRTSSATTHRIGPVSDSHRCLSAKMKTESPPDIGMEDGADYPENFEEHKVGCPWSKARSRSRSRTPQTSGIFHPKPWGARNPNDIPCYCRLSLKNVRENSHHTRSPTRYQSQKYREKQASLAKITEVVTALCSLIDKKRLRLTDFEYNLFFDVMKEKLHKYKDIQEQSVEQQKQKHGKTSGKTEVSPIRKPRSVEGLAAQNLQPYQVLQPMAGGNPAELPPKSPNPNSGVLGKLETKKYYLEVRSEDQVPPGLKQMLGMMAPQEKQFVLMDGSQATFIPSDELRQYTILNSGVQLRHHEENTTFLLGNQRMTAPSRHVKIPALIMPSLPKPRRP